ncbi:MAG: hypothetical protein AB1700_15410 [Bacillota bacterium]
MMVEERRLLSLAAELATDMQVVQTIVGEVKKGYASLTAGKEPDLLTMMGLAALLHHFYSATESAFERIVKYFDGGLPTGESWHRDLLARAATEIPDVRPVVISKALQKQLDDYRRFRHLFRNVYELNLDWDKLIPLLSRLPAVNGNLQEEFGGFTEFLRTLAAETSRG